MSDPKEREEFLTKLYTYLVEQMHETLNKNFAYSTADMAAPVQIGLEHIRSFAHEAEGRGMLDLAAKHHQECIARRKTDVSCWYEYGCFCMRSGDVAKAEECFREAVSLDQTHGPSLLLAAIIAWMNEQFDVATKLFEAATHFYNEGKVWAIRSLYHTLLEDTISAENCMSEALGNVTGDDARRERKLDVFMDAAKLLLRVNATTYLEGALRELKLEYGDVQPPALQVILVQYYLQQSQFEDADALLETAVQQDMVNPTLWALRGHYCFKYATEHGGDARAEKLAEARDVYQRALDFEDDCEDIELVRLRLAELYLQNRQYANAKELFLHASNKTPSALTWQGVGISCYRLGSLHEAEQALAESNMYDNSGALVWGYLSLICLDTGRKVEAEQTYKYAMRAGLDDKVVLAELASKQEEKGFGNTFIDA